MIVVGCSLKLKAMVPYGLYSMEQQHLSVVCSFIVFGANTGGRTSSPGGGCSCQGTATVVRAFLVFCEGACSDNMGNKESNVGIFSFSDGIKLKYVPHCRSSEGSLFLISYEKEFL